MLRFYTTVSTVVLDLVPFRAISLKFGISRLMLSLSPIILCSSYLSIWFNGIGYGGDGVNIPSFVLGMTSGG